VQPTIAFTIILKRRYAFYVFQVVAPAMVLPFMNVFTFLIPIGSGERLGYCVSLFLSFIVLMEIISDSVPKVSSPLSYLQLYIHINFGLAMLATVLSIITSYVYHQMLNERNCALTKLVSKYCMKKDNKVLALTAAKDCTNHMNEEICNEPDKNEDDKLGQKSKPEETICRITLVMFWTFLFIYFTMTSVFLIVLLLI